jgi:hypothetical protein
LKFRVVVELECIGDPPCQRRGGQNGNFRVDGLGVGLARRPWIHTHRRSLRIIDQHLNDGFVARRDNFERTSG